MPKKNSQKAFEHDTSNILPCDIMFSIFICLPIKILFRFQSVSKSWKGMICDRNFQRNHRDYYKALGQQKLLLRQRYSTDFVFRDPESPQLVVKDDDKQFFPPKGFKYSEVYASCDGLVLLKNRMAYKYYLLWNPSTRQSRILECPYVKYKHDPPNACGLYYDSRTDDYKVVLIFRYFYVIYSSSNHSWTTKTSPADLVLRDPKKDTYHPRAISTRDYIFWSMRGPCVDTTSTLMYFDVTSEEVKKISATNLDFVGEEELFCLASIKGCLSLYGGKIRDRELQVWIMEEDGWKLLLNICNLPTTCNLFIPGRQLLHLTKNGQVIFRGDIHDGVTMYDPKQQQFVTVLRQDLSVASVCLDTLYFLKPKPTSVTRKRKQSIIPG